MDDTPQAPPFKDAKAIADEFGLDQVVIIGRRHGDGGFETVTTYGRSDDDANVCDMIGEHAAPGATVYTDEARGYQGMDFDHEAVNHSAGEYVRGMAHTNGIESFWAMLKRGYQGTFHHFSEKHCDRYVNEFAGRHNDRDADTLDIMGHMAKGLEGKRLQYRDLIA